MEYPVQVQGIKDKLVGLGPWLNAAANLPSPFTYDDSNIQTLIPARIREWERLARYRVREVQVSTTPSSTYPATSTRPLVEEDPYDFYDRLGEDYFRISFKCKPVQYVQSVRVVIGQVQVYTFDPSWFSLKKREGVFSLIPTYGSFVVSGAALAFAQISMAFGPTDYMPNAVQVDYVAGLPYEWWTNDAMSDELADIQRSLEEFCAIGVLNDIAQLPDAGLRSVSMSGAGGGESLNYTRFEDRKRELIESTTKFTTILREQETPILLGVI